MPEVAETKEQAVQASRTPGANSSESKVFISYASADKAAADSIVAALEREGISCWIAPRDVTPGVFYADAIVQALNAARLLIVLLSAHSVDSQHVLREVERASSKKRPLLVFRLDATPLPASLEYFLSASHWLDASGRPIPAALPQLLDAVRQIVAMPVPAGTEPPTLSIWQRLKDNKVAQWTIAYAAFAFAFLRGVALLIEAFAWPHEILRVSTIVMLIGLPVVSILAWYHGVRAVRRVTGSELLLIGLLLAIGGSLLSLVPRPTAERPRTETANPPTSTNAKPDSAVAVFAPPAHSIAVLPFVNLSGDKEQEYFSEGLTEELLNALSRINELQVAARTSSFSFQGEHPDITTVAHKLNVGAVLEGSVRRSANTIRITAQLVNGVSGFHVWSQTYDRSIGDVLAIQTEIANAVARGLKVTLLNDLAAKVELGGTRNPAAFDAYLRGLKIYNTVRDYRGEEPAITAFTEAIKLDPGYAMAFANRSFAQASYAERLPQGGGSAEVYKRAQADAQRAIDLAPSLADGHLALAFVYESRFLDFVRASSEYDRALELAPGYARVLRNYGTFAVKMGRTDAGIAAGRRAVALDPLNPSSHGALAGMLSNARQYRAAIAALQEAIDLAPEREPLYAGWVAFYYFALGDLESARIFCEKATNFGYRRECLAIIYEKLGRHADAEAVLADIHATMGDVAAYQYAQIAAQWGNHAQALDWLNTAVRVRDPGLSDLKVDWQLDPIRDDPRFQAIERALKFPPP